MKKYLLLSLCIMLLLSVSLVIVSAEEVYTEIVTVPTYDYSEMITYNFDGEMVTFPCSFGDVVNGDGEAQTYIFSYVDENGEEQTKVYSFIGGSGSFVGGNVELSSYVISNGMMQGGMVVEKVEGTSEEGVTASCTSLVAPSMSVILLSGALAVACVLKKRRNEA